MNSTRTITVRRVRATFLALFALAVCLGVVVDSADAAATLNVTANPKKAGGATALTINTALSGTGNAKKQYGARINLPGTFRVSSFPAYGGSGDRCPAGSYSALNTGLTPPATAFSDASCPASAKIGTATLGTASGSIYVVESSPLPELGVYFQTGVTTPYGRKLSVTYNGAAPTLQIAGLLKTSTNGLTLTFDNPSRPNGLPTKFWGFVSGMDGECLPTSTVTGNVWTWPYSGSTATSVSMSPKTVSITGCGMSFQALTSSLAAGSETSLTLKTPLTGTGNDTKQYGARFDLPGLLRIKFPAYGDSSQQCAANSFSSVSTGFTPIAFAFSNSSCPPEAKVGTATLGSMSGSIYFVNASPLPQFGVYFDQGVATPFGRKLNTTYTDSAPTLMIMGLPNASTSGLQLVFDNPTRPTLPGKIWEIAGPGYPECLNSLAYGTVYSFPASGTATVDSTPMHQWLLPTGC